MTSYAAWYYMAQPAGGTHLYQMYATQPDQGLLPPLQHLPEEDALAREIAASAQGIAYSLPEEPPEEAASDFINGMYATHSPQLAYLCSNNPCLSTSTAHSVLIYGDSRNCGKNSPRWRAGMSLKRCQQMSGSKRLRNGSKEADNRRLRLLSTGRSLPVGSATLAFVRTHLA
jgi:hypothetical protein